jgi:energy-coupling factor transporter transmembrane protein EcfT
VISFHDSWGSGNARMRRLTPSARIVCGSLVFACCLVSPIHTPPGLCLACGAAIGWVALGGLPARRLFALSLYSMLLFLPVFLFTPWLETSRPAGGPHWFHAAQIPLEISLRGTACIFVCASTIAVLDLTELNAGLAALPIPRTLHHLLIQIAHQTAMLADESQRISTAVRIRGLPLGRASKLRFLPAMPTIWLLRIMNRAERIGVAMDMRGFETITRSSPVNISLVDGFAVTTALLMLGASIILRGLDVL